MKKKHEHIIECVRPGSIAEELGIEPGDCELVEDTYRILLQTVTEGIKSTHITTILTGINE